MAAKAYKCKECRGNMWPDTASGRDHIHFTAEELRKRLKLKLRAGKRGWSKAASPRTSPAKKDIKTLRPRRKVYGPF